MGKLVICWNCWKTKQGTNHIATQRLTVVEAHRLKG